MRIISGCILASFTLALLSGNAHAQDLFRSTNTTSHNYNFVEAQYLVGLETTPPVLATVLLDVFRNWSIKGEFQQYDFGNLAEEDEAAITVEAISVAVGGLYHRPFPLVEGSDLIAGFLVGRLELTVEAEETGDTLFEDGLNFQELYAGFRKTLARKLEGEVSLNYYRDEFDDEFTADVKLVYRVIRSFDVALAGNQLGGGEFGNIIGIGARYTW